MNNTWKATGRKVVVSDIEFCPIDPLEFSFQQMPKCYGQMIVDTEAKTITFKRTGGSAPGIYQVLVAMFINKHWTRIMKDPANKKDILTGFLLFSSNGNICYAAHKGENGLPVIDKKLNYRRYFIEELTLTMSEFYHLLEDETLVTCFFCSRKKHVHQLAKEFSFKYISPQEAQAHADPDEIFEDYDSAGFGFEEDDVDEFNIFNFVSGYEESDNDADDLGFSDDLVCDN